MRCMNSIAPSTTPTPMPSVRSRNTVSRKVASSTSRVAPRAAQDGDELRLLRHVPGHDREHRGERRERDVGGQRRRDQHQHEQHDGVDDARDRGRAPRRAHWWPCARWCPWRRCRRTAREPMLAMPCATSSQLERWRRPVMPSATTADSSDSMPPRSAIVRASGSTASNFSNEKAGSAGSGQGAGDAAELASRWWRRDSPPWPAARRARRRRPMAMRKPGQCGRNFLQAEDDRQRCRGDDERRRRHRVPDAPERLELRHEGGRLAAGQASGRAGRVIWLEKMMTAMPDGEADRDGMRDVLDVGAEPQEADREQDHARDHASRGGTRRSRAARSTAATSTMKAPAGPPIWKRLPPSAEIRKPPTMAVNSPRSGVVAAGLGDGHRQRQGDHRHRDAGDDVGPQRGGAVALAQDGDELRREQLGEGGLRCAAGGRSWLVHVPGRGRLAGRIQRKRGRIHQ